MVAEGSVGCSVVNWNLSLVFRSNVVRGSSRCVVIRCRVVLGRFGVVFDHFGGVISSSLGEVAGNGVVLRPRCKRLGQHTWWCSNSGALVV
jgi:hypothetical protein